MTDPVAWAKKTSRIVGAYAFIAIVGLMAAVATAPNGTDHGIHLILFSLIALMWALPFAVVTAMWIYCEVVRYNFIKPEVER